MLSEKLEREDLRWRILLCLQYSGIKLMREMYIWRTLNDLEFFPSVEDLRQELHYLEQKKLIVNVKKQLSLSVEWMSQLTAEGTDFVEYATGDITGIARPPKY
jgi:hypothetical protein